MPELNNPISQSLNSNVVDICFFGGGKKVDSKANCYMVLAHFSLFLVMSGVISFYLHYIDGGSADMDGQQRTVLMQTTMAPLETDQCQACEAYMKETALLQISLCVLRKKLEELYEQEKAANRREQEAYNREQETQEQLSRALGREQEVLCLLNEVKKENKFLLSALDTKSLNFVQSMVGEPRSANQMNSMAPRTPSRPGQSRSTVKAHSPEDLASLKIASGKSLSVDLPSGTDLSSTFATTQKAVESMDSMRPRTLSTANRTDVGEPIEGDSRLLSGQADTQPGREVVIHLIPGGNKEQGQGQETEDVTMVDCTLKEAASDELHVLSAGIGPSPNEVQMTSLDERAKCLQEALPVPTTAEGLCAAGCESVGMLTSDNQIEIGNLLKGDADQVSGQVEVEVEEGGGTPLIHCEDEEQGRGDKSTVVETGEHAVGGNIVDGIHDVKETSGSFLSDADTLSLRACSEPLNDMLPVFTSEDGHRAAGNKVQCEGRVSQSSDEAGELSGHIQDPKPKPVEDERGSEKTAISKCVNSSEIEHDLGVGTAGTAISCASQVETLKPLLEDILLQHAAENQRSSDNNESTKRHHSFVHVELSNEDEDDLLLGLNACKKGASSLSKKRVHICSPSRPMPTHVTTSTGDNGHAVGVIEDVPALSSDCGDVVEGSQHRKRKPVHMVLSSDDEDSLGTCPDFREGYTLPGRKRKLFLSPTDDLGSPKTNARVGELGEGTSLQVPETRRRKDSDLNDANYPGAAADYEPEDVVMLEALRTPGNFKRLIKLGKVHGSESEEERNVANRTEIRRSARLQHKISYMEVHQDNGEEIPTKPSKGHSRARKSYGANEVEQDSCRRSARLNQNSAKKDLRRSRRARKVCKLHEGESDSGVLVLETDGGQRSARLKHQSSRRRSIPIPEFARSFQDNEDEIDNDEENLDSFIADSDEVVSESPDREHLSGATAASPTKQKRKKKKYTGPVNPSDSESSGMLIGRLFRSARDKERSPSVNNVFTSESSDDTKVVNLLRTENDTKEEEDERDDDSLLRFIVTETLHSEDSVSDGSNEESNSSSTGGSSIMGDTPSRREVLRKRKQLDWEYEADMLAAMANDSELALQAVCALYRQQTEDERRTKDSLYANKRGFDKFHAVRASNYAEFLTAGDLAGTVKKSVKELGQRFPGALKFCHQIAAHHSKQLFEIYETCEDPLWSKRIL